MIGTNWNRRGFFWTSGSTQRGGGFSFLGNTQKTPGHGPGQLALGVPAWAGGLDRMVGQRALPASCTTCKGQGRGVRNEEIKLSLGKMGVDRGKVL